MKNIITVILILIPIIAVALIFIWTLVGNFFIN
jgi:hypothetical protein